MPVQSGTHVIHIVLPGESLSYLANRYDSDPAIMTQVNALYPPFTEAQMIMVNQALLIPVRNAYQAKTLYVISTGDTIWSIASRYATSPELLAGINDNIQNPGFIYPNQQIIIPAYIYQVETNDSIVSISSRSGIAIQQIILANSNRASFSPDLIREGYRLIIPLPSSTNIVVTSPFPGTTVQNNQRLTGYARAYEATVLYRLYDSNGVEVIRDTGTMTAYGAPAYSSFEDNLLFDQSPTSSEGILEVYTRSAMDGSVQDLVQVKLILDQ
ncbi:LysM peptidoglycan-binding domain-containing protein [Gracilibacillus oryzae]|nr:LysM peptidoglycan-binding domain-containing protein [Gracilibacillus oryzae]